MIKDKASFHTKRRAAPRLTKTIVLDRDGPYCHYCGSETKLYKPGLFMPMEHRREFDHVLPISKGGSHHPSNVVIACARCNRSKRDKRLGVWENNEVMPDLAYPDRTNITRVVATLSTFMHEGPARLTREQMTDLDNFMEYALSDTVKTCIREKYKRPDF